MYFVYIPLMARAIVMNIHTYNQFWIDADEAIKLTMIDQVSQAILISMK